MTIKTLHALTGLHIDHYMQVNLLGFYRISNAIGGVTVCLNAAQNATTDADAFGSGYSGINLPKGVSVIKGAQALAFVRQRTACRTATSTGSSASSTSSRGVPQDHLRRRLLNPFKMHDLLNAVGSSLLTDPSLDVLSLARQFESLTSGEITFATIPNNGPQLIYPDGVETSIVEVKRPRCRPSSANWRARSTARHRFGRLRHPRSPSTYSTARASRGWPLATATGSKPLGSTINTVDSTAATAATTIEYPAGAQSKAKAVAKNVAGRQDGDDAGRAARDPRARQRRPLGEGRGPASDEGRGRFRSP